MRAAGGREDTNRGQEAQVCPAARLHWEGVELKGLEPRSLLGLDGSGRRKSLD